MECQYVCLEDILSQSQASCKSHGDVSQEQAKEFLLKTLLPFIIFLYDRSDKFYIH